MGRAAHPVDSDQSRDPHRSCRQPIAHRHRRKGRSASLSLCNRQTATAADNLNFDTPKWFGIDLGAGPGVGQPPPAPSPSLERTTSGDTHVGGVDLWPHSGIILACSGAVCFQNMPTAVHHYLGGSSAGTRRPAASAKELPPRSISDLGACSDKALAIGLALLSGQAASTVRYQWSGFGASRERELKLGAFSLVDQEAALSKAKRDPAVAWGSAGPNRP
jgi:hypothetical protein